MAKPRYPLHSVLRKVSKSGISGYRNSGPVVGRLYAGATIRITEADELVHVYLGNELIGTVAFDPDRRYQPLHTESKGAQHETLETVTEDPVRGVTDLSGANSACDTIGSARAVSTISRLDR